MSKEKKKPIGELLKLKGIITNSHIEYALQVQKVTKEKLGEILERLGFVTDHDIVICLSEQEEIPFLNIQEIIPKEEVLKLINKTICINNLFLPLAIIDDCIEVVIYNIWDIAKIQQLIRRQTGRNPKLYLAEKKNIINAINTYYYFFENPVEKLIETEINLFAQDSEMARGVDNIIKYIFHLAIKMRTTDIHIHPVESTLDIAFRIDGVMSPVLSFPINLNRIITSLKMKADMDIAEQRLPQDGRFSTTILDNEYDLRVSTTVSPGGENMVLRILPKESGLMGLEQLGFFKKSIAKINSMFNEPFGIILITGPTGSGKSTTLYSGIRNLNLMEKNIITVEDPIEYQIPLIRQTQVNTKAGYTFANAIRYFLRHDPDVILLGEIRDSETAATAVSAATTGHLVLSTLHTNTAIGAIPRLQDLGVAPYLIGDSLIGVMSQRLVRKICNSCKVAYKPRDWELSYLQDKSIKKLYMGKGCELCNQSGYFGRTLVYEILVVDRKLTNLINKNSDLSMIAKTAKESGFNDIFDIMITKIKMGITTIKEGFRVLGRVRQESEKN